MKIQTKALLTELLFLDPKMLAGLEEAIQTSVFSEEEKAALLEGIELRKAECLKHGFYIENGQVYSALRKKGLAR